MKMGLLQTAMAAVSEARLERTSTAISTAPTQNISRYPCNGRERTTKPYTVQNGHHEFEQNGVMVRGKPRYEVITSEFKPGCPHGMAGGDDKCQGCGHRALKI